MGNFSYFLRAFADFIFRRRSPALILLRCSVTLVVASLFGWSFGIELPTEHGLLSLEYNSDASSLSWLVYLASIAGAAGLLMSFVMLSLEYKQSSKRLVGIIELRGLRNFAGQSIEKFWQADMFQHKHSIVVDIRENIIDGQLTSPQTALDEISRIPSYLKNLENGRERNDVSYVAGGLAAVPFTFLAGILLDDEHDVTLVDWNRHSRCWQRLDTDDDGESFMCDGLDIFDGNADEISLLVSMSYSVDQEATKQIFPNLPQIQIWLNDRSVNNHWSEAKQQRLGEEFLNVVQMIGNAGVKKIHLFLAAQNSVVLRLSSLYDKRNLPELIVYQYERSMDNPYPWGVKMPVSGNQNSKIIYT